MKVYVLVHETYAYWDNMYDVEIKSFKNERSAINYLSILKNEILNYYLEDVDAKTIEEFTAYLGDALYTFDIEDDNWFKIDVEETGYDILYIEEQDVMEFEI